MYLSIETKFFQYSRISMLNTQAFPRNRLKKAKKISDFALKLNTALKILLTNFEDSR